MKKTPDPRMPPMQGHTLEAAQNTYNNHCEIMWRLPPAFWDLGAIEYLLLREALKFKTELSDEFVEMYESELQPRIWAAIKKLQHYGLVEHYRVTELAKFMFRVFSDDE